VWGSAADAQQLQRLGGIERGEQRGEDGGVGEQQREAVDELRPRHRRVRRPQDGGGGCAVLPPALLAVRRAAAEMHGAGLGEEEEGEREGQCGEERAGALGEAVAEEEEQLGRRREPRGDEDAAEAARQEVRRRQQRRVRAREQRGGGERQRQQRRRGRRRVVVPEGGVQRRADHLAGAAHHPLIYLVC